MNVQSPSPSPSPSRLLVLMAFVARWLLGLALAIWFVLLASWGVLHGWIVPRIETYRPVLERQATRILGVPVRIGGISAETVGLMPSFEAKDVALYDPQGNVALRLPRVAAVLSPRSIWNLGFEQLYIDAPVLDVRRARDGKIFVAGLDLGGGGAGDHSAERWFFSQTEFVIHEGQLRWTDEQRGVEPLALSHVSVLVRNTARRHAVHLDAALPPEWGGHFSVDARFRQPLLSLSTGNWQDWEGQVFANFDRVDVSRLRHYADLGLNVDQGKGSLRLWADLARGQLTGATADMALLQVRARLNTQSETLTLRAITGRLGGKRLPQGFEFSTQNLQFVMTDGRRWPGGNVNVVLKTGDPKQASMPALGELHADQLDLAALGQMANLLPLGTATHAAIKAYALQGLVEKLDAHWQGQLSAPTQFDAKGRVSGFQAAAGSAFVEPATATASKHIHPGRPGVVGATADFDLTQAGGTAKLAIQSGTLTLPGVLEDPTVRMDALAADLSWTVNGDKVAVQASRLHFANPDTEGDVRFNWRTSDPAKSAGRSRFPGVLDLQGSLSRGEGTQVHRYLPLVLAPQVREYVRNAVQQGRLNTVKLRVKGDLHDLPFRDPRRGEFRLESAVENLQFAYVPVLPGASDNRAQVAPAWPVLSQLNGTLIFDRTTLQVRAATGRVLGLQGVQITNLEAQISDLAQAVVQVNCEARGPAAEMLTLVTQSPVDGWTNHVLEKATLTGNAELKLRLNLPIQALATSKVLGTVTLAGNEFHLNRELPPLNRARGVVTFSETGFAVQGQAGLLGGDVRIEGGTTPRKTATLVTAAASGAATGAAFGLNTKEVKEVEASVQFRALGTVTAEGLQQARDLGFLSRLADHATGNAAYSATVAVRRGVAEVMVQSNLQGLAVNLPSPLKKSAEASLPLRYENALLPGAVNAKSGVAMPLVEQMTVELGNVGPVGGGSVGSLVYVRDLSGPEARVLRGGIGVGLNPGESVPVPAVGVAANVNLGDVDVDAWETALSRVAGTSAKAMDPGRAPGAPAADSAGQGYLPTVIALRAKDLQVGGHHIQNVVVGGSRDGSTWRANVDANELSGYLEYRQSSGIAPGRVFARLARLTIASSAATQVEEILNEQPASIPALDIVVEDMTLRGKKLGRIEVDAVNRGALTATPGVASASASASDSDSASLPESAVVDGGREWRLNKLNVILPEATFSATGRWAGAASTFRAPGTRRTTMNFKLEIADAGQLLNRFGMKDVVKQGHGKLEGDVSWRGSPLALDYPTLGGQFNVNVESGQFLKADPVLAKLLGVLSLQSLPRRLTLDFRDVFSDGFAFDFLRGDAKVAQGVAATNNLQMKGVSAAVLMEGRADIAKETQDLKVVVVPEINAGTASLVATVINPVIGLSTFLAQLVLRRPLIEAATQEFHVSGTWTDPKIVKVDRRAAATPTPSQENLP